MRSLLQPLDKSRIRHKVNPRQIRADMAALVIDSGDGRRAPDEEVDQFVFAMTYKATLDGGRIKLR